MYHKKEIWKEIRVNGRLPSVPYVISNHGRFGVIASGKVEVRDFKPIRGNYRYNIRQHGKNYAIFLSREVARAFLRKSSTKQTLVIHKNHDYLDNHVNNLKWASVAEHRAHTLQSPRSVESREKKAITRSSRAKVLSERQAIALKKMIWNPNRKMSFRQIAKKFGVSEMQIYRIKTGEFWYHIRVNHEPAHPKYKQNLSNIRFHQKKADRASAARKKTLSSNKKRNRPAKGQRNK